MAEKKTKKKTPLLVWAVLGLLVLAFGGFGVSNFGGSVRTVGSVGDTEISVNDYFIALRGALRNAQGQTGTAVSLASPEGTALAQQVLGQMIATKALEHETDTLGLSVGDAYVRDQVLSTSAFQGFDGQFDRATYTATLRQNNMSEQQFEENIRTNAASDLTSSAVVTGFAASPALVDRMAAFLGERRDILWLKLDADTLPEPIPAPTEAELQAQYDAHPEAYTAPEMRRITYASLTPEMMSAEITVDEAELRRLYDERSDEYNIPARRLVERLIFSDLAAAEAAKARLDSGEATFETLVEERGLTLADIDLGDVTEAELGEAGAAVFALDAPGVAGPVESMLGPALFRVNEIFEAQSTPFEDVRDQLADEVNLDRARREIAALREDIDDRLAGGATLEELAGETPMQLGTIELAPDTAEGIAAYAAFRDAAAAARPDDFPELIELEDGGLAALRLDEVVPPTLRPLDEVREQVAADWTTAETEKRLMALSEEIRSRREAGESLLAQGYVAEVHQELARGRYLDGAPANLLEAAFGLEPGETAAIAQDGVLHLVELTRIRPEDPANEESAALRAQFSQSFAQSLRQDALSLFIASVESDAGLSINQTAIEAVRSQFP